MTKQHCSVRKEAHRLHSEARASRMRRRPGLVRHERDRRQDILMRYLQCYVQDSAILMDLKRCQRRHGKVLQSMEIDATVPHGEWRECDDAAVRALIDEIDAFAARYGLTWFLSTVLNVNDIRQLILHWLVELAFEPVATHQHHLTVVLPDTPPVTTPTSDDTGFSLKLDGHWNPVNETRAEVMARMSGYARTLIAGQLDVIAERYEDLGYSFERDRPELNRHLRWLFLRVALGKTPVAIMFLERGMGHDVTERAIQNATNQLAREIGLRLPKSRTT